MPKSLNQGYRNSSRCGIGILPVDLINRCHNVLRQGRLLCRNSEQLPKLLRRRGPNHGAGDQRVAQHKPCKWGPRATFQSAVTFIRCGPRSDDETRIKTSVRTALMSLLGQTQSQSDPKPYAWSHISRSVPSCNSLFCSLKSPRRIRSEGGRMQPSYAA